VTASLTPVLFFLLSVPVAFVDTSLAAACWFLTVPFGLYLNHRAPARANELLG
jgi:TMEM175 potassium channel family protein